jgi:hypothetical protein
MGDFSVNFFKIFFLFLFQYFSQHFCPFSAPCDFIIFCSLGGPHLI